jgi:hypothetical protein
MSGVPFTSGSLASEVPANSGTPLRLSFPYVTRFFQVYASGTQDLRVGFSESGVKGTLTSNYFIVKSGQASDVLELRTKDLYFLSDTATATGYRVIAGLTTIESSQFPILTGSINGDIAFEGIG